MFSQAQIDEARAREAALEQSIRRTVAGEVLRWLSAQDDAAGPAADRDRPDTVSATVSGVPLTLTTRTGDDRLPADPAAPEPAVRLARRLASWFRSQDGIQDARQITPGPAVTVELDTGDTFSVTIATR
ncbi:hypothetical protein [Kitasatospora sp. NPDC088783]|uniref:hypothetical protein n=1 Tax=Kitasatospora sp. NPDC088783 TaxID=3364077 RepID=UPI0038214783